LRNLPLSSLESCPLFDCKILISLALGKPVSLWVFYELHQKDINPLPSAKQVLFQKGKKGLFSNEVKTPGSHPPGELTFLKVNQ